METHVGNSISETAETDKKLASKEGSSGKCFDKLICRHWDTWEVTKKGNHVFICSLSITDDGLFIAIDESLIDLMKDIDSDCPEKGPGYSNDSYTIDPKVRVIVR